MLLQLPHPAVWLLTEGLQQQTALLLWLPTSSKIPQALMRLQLRSKPRQQCQPRQPPCCLST
jgi:hypothetical protein